MNRKIPAIVLLVFFAIAGNVQAHGASAGSGSATTVGNYELEFSTAPEFPVTESETEIFLEVHDTLTGKDVSDLEIQMEIHDSIGREVFSEKAHEEEEHGLYGIHYTFSYSGKYEVHTRFEMNGTVVEKEFSLTANSLGAEGIIQISVSFALVLFLVAFIIRDYKNIGKASKKNAQIRGNVL